MSKEFFQAQMKEILKDDYDKFVDSLSFDMAKSLRINPTKANYDIIKDEIDLSEVTGFDKDTYYINDESKLGKHPYHFSGLYYLQEPSATLPVNALDVKEGDYVCDLCSAPGGKATQILGRLNRTGFLLSNEYDKKRANILLSNLERWGNDNYLLTNSNVEDLCDKLIGFFDKIVVDAPCSGASMFKKYPDTINDYNLQSVLACQKRQLHILDYGCKVLKENGTLVYSTCTYNLEENEQVVEKFLENHPEFELVDTGLTAGQKGYDKEGLTRRVFPFQGGEGHFIAKFIKKESDFSSKVKYLNYSSNKLVDSFIKDNCLENFNYTIINDRIYYSQKPLLDIKANVIRSGILVGEIVKNRIEPAHHFFLSDIKFKNVYNIMDRKQADEFLKGLSLNVEGYKGYVQICYKDAPIGFGKGDNQTIKNHFPKGLRIV